MYLSHPLAFEKANSSHGKGQVLSFENLPLLNSFLQALSYFSQSTLLQNNKNILISIIISIITTIIIIIA